MRSALFLRRSAVGWPSSMARAVTLRPAPSSKPNVALPLYVAPSEDEALFSWMLRLATRLRCSMHALASCTFGIDDRYGHSRWWCRPHPWLLKRISERTGVEVARLRTMTFEGWAPIYRDDEDSGRFSGRRYDRPAPDHRTYRFVVCGQCLEGDAKPYLRSSWLIGWMAVCPIHGTQLIDRCPACGAAPAWRLSRTPPPFLQEHVLAAQRAFWVTHPSLRTRPLSLCKRSYSKASAGGYSISPDWAA